MKVMKVLDKKVGSTIYYKYRLNLPKELVEKSKLLGKDLVVKLDKNKIVITIEN